MINKIQQIAVVPTIQNKNNEPIIGPKPKISQEFSGKFLATLPSGKLSPQTFGINFTGKLPHSEIIKEAGEILEKCNYGKKNVLKHLENFKITCDNNSLTLSGFRPKDEGNEICGVCEELTYKVGKLLQKQFGDKYLFYAANEAGGNFSKYNMDHVYLIAFKNTPENIQRIETLKNNREKITSLAQQYFSILSRQDLADKRIDIEKTIKSLVPQPKDFSNELLIDPSFNLIKQFSASGKISGYSQLKLWDLEEINPCNSPDFKTSIMYPGQNFMFPIGKIETLAPELGVEYGKESMLVLNLTTPSKLNDLTIDIDAIKEIGLNKGHIDIENKLGNNHPLVKFLRKARN